MSTLSTAAAAPPVAVVPVALLRQTPGERPRTTAELIEAATREYQTSGIARPVALGSVVALPYGLAEPVLTCAALRACVIDLEPGERLVASPIAGDMARWHIGTAPSGVDSASTLVWVKPTDCDLTTNLVLSTDRRVYQLTLDAPACDRRSTNPRAGSLGAASVSRVTFYFPDASVPGAAPRTVIASASETDSPQAEGRVVRTTLTRGVRGTVDDVARRSDAPVLAGIMVDVSRANFDYRIRRDKQFPWAPTQVFDDGAHTFIKIPPEAAAHPAPALFEVGAGGEKVLLNYTLRDGFYVTDRTFRRAVLVLGQGKHEERVELDNPHFGASAESSTRQTGRAGGRQP